MTRPSAKREDYEERAAILEYVAGMPRHQAEEMAREMVYGSTKKPKVEPDPNQGSLFE